MNCIMTYCTSLLERLQTEDRLNEMGQSADNGSKMGSSIENIDKSSLAAAIEQAADCIVITDPEGVIEYVNPAYTVLTGWTSEEVVGQKTSIDRSGAHPPEFYEELWKTVRSGQAWYGEITNRRKDGTLYQNEMRITPVRDSSGQIAQYIAIKHDVTERRHAEGALRSSLDFAQSTIDALTSHVCVLDEEGTIIAVNRAWREFSRKNRRLDSDPNLSESQIDARYGAGANYLEVCDRAFGAWSDEAKEFARGVRALLSEKRSIYSAEYPCHSPSEQRWFLGRVTRFMSNGLTRILVEHVNITERTLAQNALLLKTTLLEGQIEATIDGILVVDESDRIILANRQVGLLWGMPQELLDSRDDFAVAEFASANVKDAAAFDEKVQYLYSHREQKSRDEIALKSGKILDRYSSPLIDSTGRYRGRIWYFRDITDQKGAAERIEFLAYHDTLTELPRRILMQEQLEAAIANATRNDEMVAVLFLDLDRFKLVNDSLGHEAGDLLLREVGIRLKGCAREEDTIARLGGDEFVVVLRNAKEVASVVAVAERIIAALNSTYVLRGQAVNVGCSIGISMYPEHGANSEALIRAADTAMYCAKQDGRNTFRFFTEAMQEEAMGRFAMEKDLRLALRREEFFLVYQPQIEIASGRITGFEALLRWQHPLKGLVPPGDFISAAENCGLILLIGEFALKSACAQAKRWQDAGLPALPVAVNVSAVQFRQPGFLDLVQRILRETGLTPEYLELELTESVLMSHAEVALSILRELKGMGLGLVIDDFGTGYSSLNYLKQFPVNKLKIDRSFIQGVAEDPDDAAIAIAIISMARSMKLKVIAEGVETEAQMAFLREHRCGEMQGYHFSRPITADQVVAMLSQMSTGGKLVFDAWDFGAVEPYPVTVVPVVV